MNDIFSAKGAVIVIGIALLVLVPLISGKIKEVGKDEELAEVLRNGEIQNLHRDLQGKVWTEEELAAIEVTALAADSMRPGGIAQTVQNRNAMIPGSQYAFEAVITDSATGKKHVFGKSRKGPGRWTWITIHIDSTREMVEKLQREQEEHGRAISPR
ncbi:hypothetical protein ACFL1X_08655 [Candidatus Hydrogenedentota bacterium]